MLACRQGHVYILENYSARGAIGAVNRDVWQSHMQPHTHIDHLAKPDATTHTLTLSTTMTLDMTLTQNLTLTKKFDLASEFDLDPEFDLDSEFDLDLD